ncbi:hypothetical protein [Noviherbaspirillum denitrificans]|uniref:hypothetical protein n=1 Tax=Noviherbaspirillum denitrificans TaxID=1968433 RepID=UPI0014835392|nr:hypothetical protein [Noviherbaspirillum denitrificans]
MDNQLTRQLIRNWLQQRQAHPEPPPSPEQIRRKVGWAPETTDENEQDAFLAPAS